VKIVLKYLPNFHIICNEMVMHQSANTLMRQTRDRLLSRLMSGALDVEELDIAFPQSMEEELAAQAETSSTD
jgi:type I restriction enzyme S subunit